MIFQRYSRFSFFPALDRSSSHHIPVPPQSRHHTSPSALPEMSPTHLRSVPGFGPFLSSLSAERSGSLVALLLSHLSDPVPAVSLHQILSKTHVSPHLFFIRNSLRILIFPLLVFIVRP